jgi:hypothetical protein
VEGIGATICFIIAGIVLFRDRTYKANQFFALAFFFYGWFMFAPFLYDLFATELMIQIFFRVSLISGLMGSCWLYLSMKILTESELGISNRFIWSFFGFSAIFGIIIISIPGVVTIIGYNPVNTITYFPALVVLALYVIIVYMITIRQIIVVRKHISKDNPMNKRLTYAIIGMIVIISSIIFQGIGSITELMIFDILFYAVLNIGVFLLALSLNKKQREEPSTKN